MVRCLDGERSDNEQEANVLAVLGFKAVAVAGYEDREFMAACLF